MSKVVYLMSGRPHLPYLVASLHTLRKHWDGNVEVHAWKESFPIVKKIARDATLGITAHKRKPKWRGRNAQFLDKIDLVRSIERDHSSTMYLDADTTIHGDISPVMRLADLHGFAATQFNDWDTSKGAARRRISWLEPFEFIDKTLLQDIREAPFPSVNGGVWAARPNSPVLTAWYNWTWQLRKKLFIADEVVLHVMQPKFGPVGKMATLCQEGRFNTSPKFQSKSLKDEDVVVFHYHGDSNVRPKKTQRGVDLWMPIHKQCLEENVGGIADWMPDVKNKWLRQLEEASEVVKKTADMPVSREGKGPKKRKN